MDPAVATMPVVKLAASCGQLVSAHVVVLNGGLLGVVIGG
jgi:hypothetical protein